MTKEIIDEKAQKELEESIKAMALYAKTVASVYKAFRSEGLDQDEATMLTFTAIREGASMPAPPDLI